MLNARSPPLLTHKAHHHRFLISFPSLGTAVKLGLASVVRRIVQEQETKLGAEPLSAFLQRRGEL